MAWMPRGKSICSGKLARGYEAALADYSSQQEAFHDLRVSLLADVALTYFQIRVLSTTTDYRKRKPVAPNNKSEDRSIASRSRIGWTLDQSEAESNVAVTKASISSNPTGNSNDHLSASRFCLAKRLAIQSN